jgi:hypothetical protein
MDAQLPANVCHELARIVFLDAFYYQTLSKS